MTKTLRSYLAGVIDSDGTIGIKKSTYQVRVIKDSTQPIYSERVALKQVEPQAVDILSRYFGGRRGIDDPTAKRGKPLHVWQVTDLKAANFLRTVLPYLRIKKAQAKNCLALRVLKNRSRKARIAYGRGHAGAGKRPAHLSVEMEKLYQKAHVLNRVGR